jgi:multiple sugar transport system permease protein
MKEIFTGDGVNLLNSYFPFIILSLTGLAFKNGLYIFLLRQFFMGVPDELEESAYIDGSGVFRTFFTIILPISIPMMITVFLFAFSWCWTDDFYTGGTMFFFDKFEAPYLLINFIEEKPPKTLVDENFKGKEIYNGVIRNTAGLMVIAPLVVMYLFCQKYLVQGIERSGLTAD